MHQSGIEMLGGRGALECTLAILNFYSAYKIKIANKFYLLIDFLAHDFHIEVIFYL